MALVFSVVVFSTLKETKNRWFPYPVNSSFYFLSFALNSKFFDNLCQRWFTSIYRYPNDRMNKYLFVVCFIYYVYIIFNDAVWMSFVPKAVCFIFVGMLSFLPQALINKSREKKPNQIKSMFWFFLALSLGFLEQFSVEKIFSLQFFDHFCTVTKNLY